MGNAGRFTPLAEKPVLGNVLQCVQAERWSYDKRTDADASAAREPDDAANDAGQRDAYGHAAIQHGTTANDGLRHDETQEIYCIGNARVDNEVLMKFDFKAALKDFGKGLATSDPRGGIGQQFAGAFANTGKGMATRRKLDSEENDFYKDYTSPDADAQKRRRDIAGALAPIGGR